MIDRFNFYDIYGYLLPGSALLTILWFPFAVMGKALPVERISAAVIALGLAYIVGHILQTVLTNVLSSKVCDSKNQMRPPSDIMLDPGEAGLSGQLKERLAARVMEVFHIDLAISTDGTGANGPSRQRGDAFFQCRTFLALKKASAYTEQFEGLYALMRGLCGAFCIGGSYLVGWGASGWQFLPHEWIGISVFGLVVLSVAVSAIWSMILGPFNAKRKRAEVALSISIVLCALLSGWMLGRSNSHVSPWLIWGAAGVACFAGIRCYSGYRVYADLFAKSVWRDFAGFSAQGTSSASDPGK